MNLYEYRTFIKIHEADAAGILFFGNYFKLAHDGYEGFLMEKGFGVRKILEDTRYLLPLVHAEMDYKTSLRAGDEIKILLSVKKIGNSSFILRHEFYRLNGGPELAADGETVHVCIDRNSGEKIPLPPMIIKILKS
jgi:1,4-dihydroxy-2-naphthoyl-CoA hydrolase